MRFESRDFLKQESRVGDTPLPLFKHRRDQPPSEPPGRARGSGTPAVAAPHTPQSRLGALTAAAHRRGRAAAALPGLPPPLRSPNCREEPRAAPALLGQGPGPAAISYLGAGAAAPRSALARRRVPLRTRTPPHTVTHACAPPRMRITRRGGVPARLISTREANRRAGGGVKRPFPPPPIRSRENSAARSRGSQSPRAGARSFPRSESARKARPGLRSREPISEPGPAWSALYPTAFETRPPTAGTERVGRACLSPNGRWRRQLAAAPSRAPRNAGRNGASPGGRWQGRGRQGRCA